MTSITIIGDRFNFVCPCCRETVLIQIEKYENGKKIVSLIHKHDDAEIVDLSEFGIEFGVEEGGESCV